MKIWHFIIIFIISLLQGCQTLPTLDKERASSLADIYIVPIKQPFFSNSCAFCADYEEKIWLTLPYYRVEEILFDASIKVGEKTKHHLESEYNYTINMASEAVQLPGIISWDKFTSSLKKTTLPKQTKLLKLKPASYIHQDILSEYGSLSHAAEENWWSEKNSSLIYPENLDFDTALEILVEYASAHKKHGSFQTSIQMKLVDTQSRTVLAKSSCIGGWPSTDPTVVIPVVNALVKQTRNKYFQKVLTGEGANSKEVFFETVDEAVPECIEELGLLKK